MGCSGRAHNTLTTQEAGGAGGAGGWGGQGDGAEEPH